MGPRKLFRLSAILSSVGMLQGCLTYSGQRAPDLINTKPAPTLSAAPRINVVMLHKHTIDGRAADITAHNATLSAFREAFERVQDATPYLKNARIGLLKPELILEFDTETAATGDLSMEIWARSLALIPGFSSFDVIANAKLMTPDRDVLASYRAHREARIVFHLILLPLFPLNFWTAPAQVYDDTFRDIFIQLEDDVAAHTREFKIGADEVALAGVEDARSAARRLPRSNPPLTDSSPPRILIAERLETHSQKVVLNGSVRDESKIASVTINGTEVQIDDQGQFRYQQFVRIGSEEISIEATDIFANSSTKLIRVTRIEETSTGRGDVKPLDPTLIASRRRGSPPVALIIGVEKYKHLPDARSARSDANLFRDYAVGALGVPKERIIRLLDDDADRLAILKGIRRVKGELDPDSDLYVFFSGHGLASGEGMRYLLPWDADADFIDQFQSRDAFFEALATLQARSVTVFLDACYTGLTREGGAIADGLRPLTIEAKNPGVPTREGFAVISAAGRNQTSGDFPGLEHGLFSYYLMLGIQGDADQNGDREITLSELYTFVRHNVTKQAARLGREQSPEFFGDPDRVLMSYELVREP